MGQSVSFPPSPTPGPPPQPTAPAPTAPHGASPPPNDPHAHPQHDLFRRIIMVTDETTHLIQTLSRIPGKDDAAFQQGVQMLKQGFDQIVASMQKKGTGV